MGFFRSVWQDAQPAKRRLAGDVVGAALSGRAADVGQDINREFSSNRIQEADHVSDTRHQQVGGPSAALDSASTESVVCAENSGHGPQKVSQQQDSVSLGTTDNGRTSALVEESLSVDPIVTERIAHGHVFDDVLSSVNLVSLKHGLVTGEDVNRAASQNTEIRVPEQSSFVHAASVFSRDLMDLSVRVDERSFQHDFGDLDTSRASGLGTPSEYHFGDSAALTPSVPFTRQTQQTVISDQKEIPASDGRDTDKTKPGFAQRAQALSLSLPGEKAGEKAGEQAGEQAVATAPEKSGKDVLPPELASPETEIPPRVPGPDGPVLSEHQRYLQRQKHFQQAKQQQLQTPAEAAVKTQQEGKGAGTLQSTADAQPLTRDRAIAASSQDNAAPADKAGTDQALAAFNALSALAKQTGGREQKVNKAPDNSVHIGRIDVTVTADEVVKKNVAGQPETAAAGWASRHYLRRV
ncbi:hypothetical protein [Thalassomonas actiniarum]|uniref:Uncharacterized protein n=1 Tax=Thalassomonas actiniarum TaxID=485447 RepID=A0AAE9YT81_9GAMM|nr:hypothetical protein [Thalassomonas actiniarum]WDE00790.1 hypothetical protein SG35_009230 [Thalassomonas actiniarum]